MSARSPNRHYTESELPDRPHSKRESHKTTASACRADKYCAPGQEFAVLIKAVAWPDVPVHLANMRSSITGADRLRQFYAAHSTEGCDVLQRIALLAIAAPRWIVAIAALVVVGAAAFGIPVANSLSAGGFQDPSSESARASQLFKDKFRQSDQQLSIMVSDPAGVNGARARTVGLDIVDRLRQSPYVTDVTSPWTVGSPQAAAPLLSKDATSGLIVAAIGGGENNAQKYAAALSNELAHDRDGVTVRSGGTAMIIAQANHQTQRDLLLMESIAIPLTFLVLVWVFGGLLAATLPIAIGGMAIVGGMSVLRLFTFVTDVSIFALNLTTAIGLALAVDYTLLIISRYREELANGLDREAALINTMTTAGRTVLFSAVTVALSLSAMVLFPMYFLKSFAYAGIATVMFVVVAAIVVTPAAIVLLGSRLDSLDVRRLIRRLLRRPEPQPKPVEQLFWHRCTKFVMRRAVPIGLAVIALLLFLATPFLGVKWGYPDDRVLPPSASSHQVGDVLRNDFGANSNTQVAVVVPDADGVELADLDRYAADLSRVVDVSAVAAPTGTFIAGRKVGPAGGAPGASGGSAYLTVSSFCAAVLDAVRSATRRAARRRQPWRRARPDDRLRGGQPRQRRRHRLAGALGTGAHRDHHPGAAVPPHRKHGATR